MLVLVWFSIVKDVPLYGIKLGYWSAEIGILGYRPFEIGLFAIGILEPPFHYTPLLM